MPSPIRCPRPAVLAAVAIVLAWPIPTTMQAEEAASSPTLIRKLIDDLGHAKFSERNQAARQLEALGQPALEPLRLAMKNPDAEVSFRASLLVSSLEQRMLTETMLAPKRVRLDVKDMLVADAVAALAKLSNCPIDLAGDRTQLANRRVTLDTGEVTFWEAFDQLCRKAGLAEFAPPPVQPQPTYYYGPNGAIPQNHPPQSRNISVGVGVPRELPVCFAGSVRIRAVPAENTGTLVPVGETQFALDLSAESRLHGFGAAGSPVLTKALDDQGQSLALAPPPSIDPLAAMHGNVNGIVVVNGVVVRRTNVNQPSPQRTVTVRLKKGDKASKFLKEVSGKLSVQTLSQSERYATVNNVRKAAGQKLDALDGSTVQILSVDNAVDGVLVIQVGLDSVTGAVLANRFRFNNQVSHQVPFGGPANYPKLFNDKGIVFNAELSNQRTVFTNGGMTQQVTLTYRCQGEPSQLGLYGQRVQTFDVPFTLKNVPLP